MAICGVFLDHGAISLGDKWDLMCTSVCTRISIGIITSGTEWWTGCTSNVQVDANHEHPAGKSATTT